MKRRILGFILFCTFLLSLTAFPSNVLSAEKPPLAGLEQYHINTYLAESSGSNLDIPVQIDTYKKGAGSANTTELILYVMNANMERIGMEDDVSIISDLLDDDCIVLTLDFMDNAKAAAPLLEWDVQQLRGMIDSSQNGQFGDIPHKTGMTYVLPAGYRLERNVEYFNYAEHGTKGTLDYIVDNWNNAFKAMFKDNSFNGHAYPGDASTIADCVKPDGSPIDLSLKMDIMYPSQPDHEVPVMALASSSETRIGSMTNSSRPHLSGFLFNGYAGVVFDHTYVPMARNDHYGYYEESELTKTNSMKADTAAVRYLRYAADKYPDKYKFDKDAIGVMGHSKSAHSAVQLGLPHPEAGSEQGTYYGFEGNYGEQPWLTYTNGEQIPSNVQFVYASGCGPIPRRMVEPGYAPVFNATGIEDSAVNGVGPTYENGAAFYRADVPFVGVEMPGVGHTLVQNIIDEETGMNMYRAFFDFAGYYLRHDPVSVLYITPKDGTMQASADQKIKVKFTGPVSEDEVTEKVTVKNLETGETVGGQWEARFGKTEWIFTPYMLTHGAHYDVSVGNNIIGDNGQTIQEGKQISFSTLTGVNKAPLIVSGQAESDNLVTVGGDNNLYIQFDKDDYEDSFQSELQFSVLNDAVQKVEIYAVNSFDEAAPENSIAGELLETVSVNGNGIYTANVSAYISRLTTDEKPAFMLKAREKSGVATVREWNFDNSEADPQTTVYWSHYQNTRGTTDADNHTPDGSRAYQFTSTGDANNNSNTEELVFYNVFRDGNLTDEDYGRRFHISAWIKTTIDNRVYVSIRPPYNSGMDPEHDKYIDRSVATCTNAVTKANEWQKISFDFNLDELQDVRTAQVNMMSFMPFHIRDGEPVTLYIDDILVEEVTTDVDIASKNSAMASAPMLVLHPSKKTELSASDATYVVSGRYAEESYEQETELLVSGAQTTVSASGNKKVYLKIPLEGAVEMSKHVVNIQVLSNGNQELDVYGLSFGENHNWAPETINWQNAPANDRFGSGVNMDKVYGGAPLDHIVITGADEYSMDVTDYINEMIALGSDYATLILVSTAQGGKPVFEQSWDDKSKLEAAPWADTTPPYAPQYDYLGGTVNLSDEDHTTGFGKSLSFQTIYSWDRLKIYNIIDHNLTQEDIGRQYEVSFWIKANKAGTFRVSLQSMMDNHPDGAHLGANNRLQPMEFTLDEADTWQQFTYPFTVTPQMVQYGIGALTPALLSFTAHQLGNFAQNQSDTITMYLDDFVTREVGVSDAVVAMSETEGAGGGVSGYRYIQNFDSLSPSANYNGQGAAENNDQYLWLGAGLPSPSGYFVSDEENYSLLGEPGQSMKIVAFETTWGPTAYARLKFYNMVDHKLTEADLGRKFKVTFQIKTNRAGNFYLGLKSANGVGGDYYDNLAAQEKMVAITEPDKWQMVEYTFEITDEVLKGSTKDGVIYPAALLNLEFGGTRSLGYEDHCGDIIYVDDLRCREIVEDAPGNVLLADAIAMVSDTPASDDGMIRVGMPDYADMTISGISKAYLRFEGNYSNMQDANLTFTVKEASGQKVNIYGIQNPAWPSGNVNWNNAPANGRGSEILSSGVYGREPLASLTLSGSGDYSIDVTEYLNTLGAKDAIFAFTTDARSGQELFRLNFDGESFTKDIDWAAIGGFSGTVQNDGGSLHISGLNAEGQGIRFLNAFGNEPLPQDGGSYVLRADLAVNAASTVTPVVFDADGNVLWTGSACSVAGGNTEKLEAAIPGIEKAASAGLLFGNGVDSVQIDNVLVQTKGSEIVISKTNPPVSLNIRQETIENQSFTVTVQLPENGTLTPSGTFHVKSGDDFSVTAVPAAGYRTKNVMANGVALTGNAENIYTTAILADTVITAEFEKIQSVVPTVKSPQGGAFILPSAEGSITFGTVAGYGYTIVDYGIVYSKTESEPTVENGAKLSAKAKALVNGQFGVKLIFKPALEAGDFFYTRPYVTYDDGTGKHVTVYGEAVLSTMN